MAVLKLFLVSLVLIAVLIDAKLLFPALAQHGPKIVQKLEIVEEETNAQLPRHFDHTFPAPRLNASAKAAYNFAVDITAYGSVSTFQCLYQQGYNAIFIQAYSPANGGSINPNLIQNLNNAVSAKLGTEVYVTPATGKTGQTQFDTVFNKFKNSGINVRSIWLQVTSPINWSNNVQTNVNLIQSFVNRANSNGVSAGIYTNWYDWQQITGSYTAFNGLRLWYWNSLGQGQNSESAATFDDFRTFSGWVKPAVKQFAVNENLCGLTLNRDVFPSGSKSVDVAAVEETNSNVENKLTVGGFV
uniref:Lysozyme n=1 Tax=Panagrolaimus sp. ES5 TaxID=591445 RepID=A0AC34GZU2_9BILA